MVRVHRVSRLDRHRAKDQVHNLTAAPLVAPDVRRTRWRNRRGVIVAAALVGLVMAASAAFLAGYAVAVGGLRVEHATPDRLAQAMSADEFYSDFRHDTVIVRGTVASVSATGSTTTIVFQTAGAWRTECQTTDAGPRRLGPGDTLTVVAVAIAAERLPSGVLLTGCAISP